MHSPDPSPPSKAVARRRLLRGTFSLPAVLAIHNGSALAASSNSLRCALNITLSPTPAMPNWAAAPDKWVRVTRYSTPDGKKWIKVGDLVNVATLANLPFVYPSGTNNTGWVEWVSMGPYAYGNPVGTPSSTTDLVAVLFDANGTTQQPIRVVGFKQLNVTTPPPKTSAVTTSCWASMKP